ncbi:hypothetical protein [Streptomyces nodosus]|uniref:hypothetical protein n=1 Tax=Streptomyces nodosus TaxID=40318 RepID=UPI0037F64493
MRTRIWSRRSTFHSLDEQVIPYEIMCWFMEQVAEQVERCRITFKQGESAEVE